LAKRAPTRIEVEMKLSALINDELTREAVSEWARPWGTAFGSEAKDPAIQEALEKLYTADSPSTDRPYLFGREDFEEWLRKLRARAMEEPPAH
jgi:hypothetical protein